MNSYLLAAASANREALLSLWHSAERGYATGIYSDEKALVTMATAVNSIDAFYVTGIIEYGDDYTFALGLQRYRDRTFRAVVFPFKQDGKRLALTNDLKNDPAFASFAQLAATKLKNDFLRKYPETAQ